MQPFIQLFAGTASQALAQKIAAQYGQPLGDFQVQRFSDGELRPQLGSQVQGAHVGLIQATYPPADHLIELLLTMDAAQRAGAACITAVVPYLGYARQDRAHHAGSSIGAQLVARLLTNAGLNRLITCDLHAPHIIDFFEGPVKHLTMAPVFIPYIRSLQLTQLTFVAPDVGSVARTQCYADHFQAPLVMVDKHRNVHNQVEYIQIQGNVQGAAVVIIDDIVDTGSTLFATAAQLKAQGARTVRAFCTHPVLSGSACELLVQSALEEIVVSDTIPLKQPSNKLKVLSAATLLAQALQQWD
ncbi:MAG: ribose-phosphate diphosphokinase [Roseivirga sp.]